MRLINFLNEIVETKSTEEEFYKLLKEKCSKNLKYMHDNKVYLYRGIHGVKNQFLKFDGTKKRKSAYTKNYYTIMFSDLLGSWTDIPKRDHSLICTSSLIKSKSYGTTYLVIPYDDTELATAHTNDFWDILIGVPEFNDNFIRNLNGLNSLFSFNKIKDNKTDIKKFLNTKVLKFYDSTKNDIYDLDDLTALLNISLAHAYNSISYEIPMRNTPEESDTEVEKYRDKLKNVKFYDVFNNLLDPKRLNIEVNTLQKLTKSQSEIWMDKSAILFKIDTSDSYEIISYLLDKIGKM